MTKGSRFQAKQATEIGGVFDFEDLHSCQEVQTLFMGTGKCYVAVNTPLQFSSSHVGRYATDVATHAWKMVPRIAKEGSSPPLPVNRHKHEKFLLDLLTHLPDLEKEAKTFFEKVVDAKKRVMVMALNEGDIDMLVNFVCSAKHANIPIDNLVVIGADQSVVDVATSLNLHSFSHKAFGHLPSVHATQYVVCTLRIHLHPNPLTHLLKPSPPSPQPPQLRGRRLFGHHVAQDRLGLAGHPAGLRRALPRRRPGLVPRPLGGL